MSRRHLLRLMGGALVLAACTSTDPDRDADEDVPARRPTRDPGEADRDDGDPPPRREQRPPPEDRG